MKYKYNIDWRKDNIIPNTFQETFSSPEEKSFMGSDFRNLALVVSVIVSISAGHWFCHSISFTAFPPSFYKHLYKHLPYNLYLPKRLETIKEIV